ncbi:MAG: prephenate dehydratase [Leptospirillia bacterium]
MEELSPLRKQIDVIDDEVLRLLNERARIALQVAAVKETHQAPLHVPEREKAILERLTRDNPGPFPAAAIVAVYREIISACLNLEGPIRVAYLGPYATFTHQAALGFFGSSSSFLPRASIPEVVASVEKGEVAYGVVPVENSTEGSVAVTLDAVAASSVTVCGEVIQRIHQCLLSKETSMDRITRVYSHKQSFGQCREWLTKNLPGVEVEEMASNAKAAEVASQKPGAAAIAGKLAGEVYGLRLLADRIEDTATNQTRFWIVSRESRPPGKDAKTSLLISIKDEPGSLYSMLRPFENHDINLSRIESRPSKQQPWEYLFFIDILGHPGQKTVKAALKEVEKNCVSVKVLGTYPQGTEDDTG